jgi:hypothetical protein
LLSPGKFATTVYVPAVAVKNLQEYAVVGSSTWEVTTDGAIVVHVIPRPDAFMIVQPMTPAGAGFPAGPVAITVKVIDPPRVGAPVDERVIVGVRVVKVNDTVLELPAT